MKFAGWWAGLALAFAAGSSNAQQLDQSMPLDSELPAAKLLTSLPPRPTPTQALAATDQALALLPQPTPFRGRVLCARAEALDALKRDAEARAARAQCRQLLPNHPQVLIPSAFDAAETRQPVEAAKLIIRAAAIDADAVRQIPPASMGTIFRQLRYNGATGTLDDLTTSLAAAGWGRDFPVDFADLAVPAILHRLSNGQTPDALAALSSIISPHAGVSMLIDRRYASIWPQIEKWAGPDLSAQRHALLEGAEAAYRTTQSSDKLFSYVEALSQTGHRDRAIKELQLWLQSPAAQADSFDRNMATLKIGNLLRDSGRIDEGIAVMRAALAGPDGKDESIANVIPNLLILMVSAKDFKSALAILDAYTPNAAGLEAEAANGYFVGLRACAIAGLGRRDEAQALLQKAQATYASNDQALYLAVSCVADQDTRARQWIARAESEDTRTSALTGLAEARLRAAKGLPANSINQVSLREIMGRKDVSATYDRFARDLPEQYGPALLDFEGTPDKL